MCSKIFLANRKHVREMFREMKVVGMDGQTLRLSLSLLWEIAAAAEKRESDCDKAICKCPKSGGRGSERTPQELSRHFGGEKDVLKFIGSGRNSSFFPELFYDTGMRLVTAKIGISNPRPLFAFSMLAKSARNKDKHWCNDVFAPYCPQKCFHRYKTEQRNRLDLFLKKSDCLIRTPPPNPP